MRAFGSFLEVELGWGRSWYSHPHLPIRRYKVRFKKFPASSYYVFFCKSLNSCNAFPNPLIGFRECKSDASEVHCMSCTSKAGRYPACGMKIICCTSGKFMRCFDVRWLVEKEEGWREWHICRAAGLGFAWKGCGSVLRSWSCSYCYIAIGTVSMLSSCKSCAYMNLSCSWTMLAANFTHQSRSSSSSPIFVLSENWTLTQDLDLYPLSSSRLRSCVLMSCRFRNSIASPFAIPYISICFSEKLVGVKHRMFIILAWLSWPGL
jgi:hypothetical protein